MCRMIIQDLYSEYRTLLDDVHKKIMSISVDMKNANQRKSWGRAIAAYDCLEDSIDAILEFNSLNDNAYIAPRPTLYYYGILQALSIQVEALKQLDLFFYGEVKQQKDDKVKKQADDADNEEYIVDVRNDIFHGCNKNGKESCFIAKSNNMKIGSLWYGIYRNDGPFSDKTINLRKASLKQIKEVRSHLKTFSSIPKEQIHFYKSLQ